MIYLELFLGFLQVGCFAFGGAYGALPLIQDVVYANGWLDVEMLTYMIAVSESTPGPIMINLATYVGSTQAGLPGAVLACLGVVLPSFLIILFITAVWNKILKNPYVQAVLRGMKPCIIGIVLATGVYMTTTHCVSFENQLIINTRAIILTATLLMILWGARTARNIKVTPVMLILLAAGLGSVFYGLG